MVAGSGAGNETKWTAALSLIKQPFLENDLHDSYEILLSVMLSREIVSICPSSTLVRMTTDCSVVHHHNGGGLQS